MGDGAFDCGGLVLCTDSFTIPDVVRLMNVLIVKYQLECTFRVYNGKYYRIYIKASSISHLRTIVLPHIHSSITKSTDIP